MYDSGSDSDYLTPDENEIEVLSDFNRNANLDMQSRGPTTSPLNHVRDRLLALSTGDAGLSPFSMERRLFPIDDSGVEKTADVVGDLRKFHLLNEHLVIKCTIFSSSSLPVMDF